MKATTHQLSPLLKATSLLLLLGACAPKGNEVVNLNACNFLLDGDIASVLDSNTRAGQRDDLGLITEGEQAGVYSSSCLWQLESKEGTAEYVILMALLWPQDKSASLFLQDFRHFAELGVISQEPIPLTLGDESLWWGDGVAVIKDNISFGISTRLVDTREKRREAEEALAALILSRL